jgi:hypothetical protein
MSTFLSRFYDPALDISGIGSREELERRQLDRISRALSVAILAGTTPRRLGGDATDEELALDKKRARRAGHGLGQALKQWTKRKIDLPLDGDVRSEGAMLSWSTWKDRHLSALQYELRLVATWAVQKEEETWGKSAIVKLENELKWTDYAFRD